jgi:hypothetical protein
VDLSKFGKPIGDKPIKKDLGLLYSEKTLFMVASEIATGETGDGTTYHVLQNIKGAIMVRSSKTGQTWLLTPSDLISLAMKNGVDETQDWEPLAK